jgi:hypothetical protein
MSDETPRTTETDGLEALTICAVDGVKEAVDGILTDPDPIVVVTVAWRAPSGNPYVIGTAVPEGHGHELLADSLRQSADEAADAFSAPAHTEEKGEGR